MGAAGLILAACDWRKQSAAADLGGSADHGKALIAERGCGGCHLIPRIAGANGNVGPPLLHIGTRVFIAGYLRNSPDNMASWLQDPQKVLPGNAMPSMGLSQQEARDITAYLYTLK
jgi:cytochrome c2